MTFTPVNWIFAPSLSSLVLEFLFTITMAHPEELKVKLEDESGPLFM